MRFIMIIPPLYTSVTKIDNLLGFESGKWDWSNPIGVTVHYSADRNIERVINWLQQEKLGYHLLIDRDGSVIQTCFFDKRVNHSGNSKWNNLNTNHHHVSICLISWGKLTKDHDIYYSWSGIEIDYKSVELRPDINGKSGFWDIATKEQEISLLKILKWFISYNIDPINICGHDESSIPKGRKQDPGGVLSLSMEAIRNLLKNKEN